MEVRSDRTGRLPVVRVVGSLRLGSLGSADPIHREVLAALQLSSLVILNLAEVSDIDSRGVGGVARCLATTITRRGELRIVMPQGEARRALEHVNLLTVFPSFETEADALAASP